MQHRSACPIIELRISDSEILTKGKALIRTKIQVDVTQCAHYREKMARSWNFSLWVRSKKLFSCNGKPFLQSYHKVCAVQSSIFSGESNLEVYLPGDCGGTGDLRSNHNIFYHENCFRLQEISILRHPVNGVEPFSVVFSLYCAQCVT